MIRRGSNAKKRYHDFRVYHKGGPRAPLYSTTSGKASSQSTHNCIILRRSARYKAWLYAARTLLILCPSWASMASGE